MGCITTFWHRPLVRQLYSDVVSVSLVCQRVLTAGSVQTMECFVAWKCHPYILRDGIAHMQFSSGLARVMIACLYSADVPAALPTYCMFLHQPSIVVLSLSDEK